MPQVPPPGRRKKLPLGPDKNCAKCFPRFGAGGKSASSVQILRKISKSKTRGAALPIQAYSGVELRVIAFTIQKPGPCQLSYV